MKPGPKAKTDINQLIVEFVRCHISQEIPGIGAKNAISIKEKNLGCELTTLGVLFKIPMKDVKGSTYTLPALVPWANVPVVLFERIYDELEIKSEAV